MRKGLLRVTDFLTWSGAALLLVLVLLFGWLRIQEWVFRHSAEQLFGEIQAVGFHTTFQQLDSVFERWHGSVSYGTPCSKEACNFNIEIAEPITWRNDSRLIPALLSIYRTLGGHPAVARAAIRVRNGFVEAKRYGLSIEAPQGVAEKGRTLTYYVEANILTKPRDETFDPDGLTTSRHPEYQIGSVGCLGCLEIHVFFTPSADLADVERLSRINFACLTRQHPCRTKEDIMPIAAREQQHPK
jgi:hypothetical protein